MWWKNKQNKQTKIHMSKLEFKNQRAAYKRVNNQRTIICDLVICPVSSVFYIFEVRMWLWHASIENSYFHPFP